MLARTTPPSPLSPPVKRRPAVSDGKEHGRQCQRQQGEVDAAPAQDERAEEDDAPAMNRSANSAGRTTPSGNQWSWLKRRRISSQPEPGAVAEGDEPGVADQNVQAEAGDGEHHHVDRRAERQADGDRG